jgi:hypothetical protein
MTKKCVKTVLGAVFVFSAVALIAVFTLPSCTDGGDGDVSDSGTDPDLCEQGDTDDPSGGCGTGFHCEENGTCDQECTIGDHCVAAYGEYWVCNEWGQCIFDGPDASAP